MYFVRLNVRRSDNAQCVKYVKHTDIESFHSVNGYVHVVLSDLGGTIPVSQSLEDILEQLREAKYDY